MLILYFIGVLLEEKIGNNAFIKFYLLAGIFASLCYAFFGTGISVGASGAISGVVTLAACMMPRYRLYLFGVFPISMLWLAILFIALDISRVIGDSAGNIAVEAHLGGAAFGFLWYRFVLRKNKQHTNPYIKHDDFNNLDI